MTIKCRFLFNIKPSSNIKLRVRTVPTEMDPESGSSRSEYWRFFQEMYRYFGKISGFPPLTDNIGL